MINRVNDYIIRNNLIPKSSKVVVAVSSGVDSMALLVVLKRLGFDVIIAHVNHQKREQSKLEEEYIINYAKENNIPCEVYHLLYNEKNNFHNEAHQKRYSFFQDVLKKHNANFLATAHHSDDNAETIILNMMRGSNLFGYGGISSKIEYNDYTIIRPLLEISKTEILAFVKENNILYFEDESNSLDDYKRNRIRHNIIPLLKDECEDFLDKITLYSKQIKEAFAYLRKDSIKFLDVNKNIIDTIKFNTFHIALKKDIICLLFERYSINKNEQIICDAIRVIESISSSSTLDLEDNYLFVKRYSKAYIIKKENDYDESIFINENECFIFKDKYKFYFTKNLVNSNAKYIKLCYNDLVFPLEIRNYKENDVILMNYGHKKLNRLFIDNKIPLEKRKNIPVIINNGEILWVYNLAKSAKVVEMKNTGDIYFVCEEISCEK